MESPAEKPLQLLAVGDYVVIGAMVLGSTAVGIYHGITKKKQSSPFEYFLAGRKMTLIPVALSAFATVMAPSTMLGASTESYNFGMQIGLWCIMEILVAFILNWIFIPVYYKMGSLNVYKFLEVRYNRKTKNVVTTVSMFRTMLGTSNGMFGMALALSGVTNVSHWIITASVVGICILYTTIGGMKGAMWTDVIQAVVMVITFLTIIIIGCIYVGGVGVVWQRSYDSGRLDIFDFSTDPTARNTFWSCTLGYFFYRLTNRSTSQLIHQRFLTAPTIEDAKRGNILQMVVFTFSLFLIQVIGLIIYANYYSCDPIKSKMIRNANQLAPNFVMEVMGTYPILPGLFFAGLLASVLSSLSSLLNSVPAILYESLIKPLRPNMPAKQVDIVCKVLCVLIGSLCCAFISVTKNFPNVIQGSVSLSATISGSIMMLIFLGLLFPQANVKAGLLSFLSGTLVCSWIVISGLLVKHPLKTKPTSIEGCLVGNGTTVLPSLFGISKNITEMKAVNPIWTKYFPLYSVSYLWISMTGVIICSAVFVILSQIFEKEQTQSAVVDVIPDALQNFHRSLSKPWRKALLCDVYDIDKKDKEDMNLENLNDTPNNKTFL